MAKIVIVARRGETLKVERLEDGITGEGYFLIRDNVGRAVRASEIMAGDMVFTMDESKRTFTKDGLEYDLYLRIKSMAEGANLKHILTKDIASSFNEKNDLGFRGITASTVGKLCRAMGFRYERTGEGYAVAVESKDLEAAGAKFGEATLP